jgi:hypothetical protein
MFDLPIFFSPGALLGLGVWIFILYICSVGGGVSREGKGAAGDFALAAC